MNHQLLGYGDLALAANLVLLNAVLSFFFDMGMGRVWLVAGARVVLQLLLVGLLLKTVFELKSPLLIAALIIAMFASASYEIISRQERRFKGISGLGLGTGTTMLATLFEPRGFACEERRRSWGNREPTTAVTVGQQKKRTPVVKITAVQCFRFRKKAALRNCNAAKYGGRDFHRQHSRKPALCQRRMVSGCTMANAPIAFGNP